MDKGETPREFRRDVYPTLFWNDIALCFSAMAFLVCLYSPLAQIGLITNASGEM